MEQIEVPGPSCPLRFGVHAPQQIGIALRVEDDDHVTTADVLGDQDLGSRVLPTRVVPSTRVCPTRSPRSIQTSCSSGSTACSAGVPPTAGRGLSGIPPSRLAQEPGKEVEWDRFPGDLFAPRPLV